MIGLSMRPLRPDDADDLAREFQSIGWSKPSGIFQGYCHEQAEGARWSRVALWEGALAGYVTLVWESEDPEFRRRGIPEILDLNVLPRARRHGIGATLLAQAEREASGRSDVVGLRVGLHSGYGAAQRLYVTRGYIPDGAGALADGEPIADGAEIRLDDDVTLRMTKRLVPYSPHEARV